MSLSQIIKDKKNWDKIIEGFKENDIYFSYNYFVPFRNYGDGEPVLYYFECDWGKVAYPFMLRDIARSENFDGKIAEGSYFDISSAYGYGGPLYEIYGQTETETNLSDEFFKNFSDFCKRSNIISQFDRFHPLIKNQLFFKEYCTISCIRKTMYIDLCSKEEIWNNIESKCRNMIRKAEKNNVAIVLDDDIKTLEDFICIYTSTMNHNQAIKYYYFNNKFFYDIIDSLGKNVFIVNAYYEGKVIASSLIMRYGKYLHYHLSGALKDFRELQANSLLLYEVAKWGSENGYKKFHLGGGYTSEDDSLYKFKKSFSKREDNDFFIGKKIYNKEQYDYLMNVLGENCEDSSFFPAYRKR